MKKTTNGIPLAAFALALLLLAGCTGAAAQGVIVPAADTASMGTGSSGSDSSVSGGASSLPAQSEVADSASTSTTSSCLFDQLTDTAIAKLQLTGREDDIERVRLAFCAVIAYTSYIPYDDPLLTDSWRWLDHCNQAPTIYQVMAASPLLYGIGSCENFACALMVLLERMGYETRYVSGLTYSWDGKLVDHAWAMVEIDGSWYHIDPQLESNVMKGSTITYKYFLKGDEDFAAHHVWGSRLANPDPDSLALPACPASAPALPHGDLALVPTLSLNAAQAQATKLQAAGAPHKLEPIGTLPPFPLGGV